MHSRLGKVDGFKMAADGQRHVAREHILYLQDVRGVRGGMILTDIRRFSETVT